MNNEKMIENIRLLCKNNNISITKLEEDLGFSQGLISRWKDKTPSLDKIIDIADYFHVTLDEVVGRNINAINDDFIKVLYDRTSNKEIQWHGFDKSTDESGIKQYHTDDFPEDFISEVEYMCWCDTHKQISYYFEYMHGYISIYAMYEHHDLLNPFDLKLFIQPDIQAELIPQHYTTEELLPLWVKVLSSLEDEAPDAIKAEDLKNSFLLDRSNGNKSNSKNKNELDAINDLLNNPQIMELMKVFNTSEVQKMQQMFSNPEFQSTMKLANRMQPYFDKFNNK